jgi:DHA2 family multidrug resistance protein
VPTSTLTYLTLDKRLQADGAALFTMFRNVAGSIGISLSTAQITSRTQVHMAYLSAHTSTSDPAFIESVARAAAAVKAYGLQAGDSTQIALGYLYQSMIGQATLLAYLDVFAGCSLIAFLFVPFTFFFSPAKAAGGAGGH